MARSFSAARGIAKKLRWLQAFHPSGKEGGEWTTRVVWRPASAVPRGGLAPIAGRLSSRGTRQGREPRCRRGKGVATLGAKSNTMQATPETNRCCPGGVPRGT